MASSASSWAMALVLVAALAGRAGAEELRRELPPGVAGNKPLWTEERLKADGRLLLVVLGEVYDVSSAEHYYGKGASYGVFVAQDATRAFVSGEFEEDDATADISDFDGSKCLGVKHWLDFYRFHDTYRFQGLLVGRYYDAQGKPTQAWHDFADCCEAGFELREADKRMDQERPRCSSKWTAAAGGRVWCEPPRVPRKVTSAEGGKQICRCFMPETSEEPSLRTDVTAYRDCDPRAHECQTTPPKKKNQPPQPPQQPQQEGEEGKAEASYKKVSPEQDL
eukprot:scaffold48_cov311-Pinguiococcus_pyrenoidosus.AAC.7